VASVVAGLLWDGWGSGATFMAGAGFAAATLLALGLQRGRPRGAAPGSAPSNPVEARPRGGQRADDS
jgi:hypothetical protein